MTYETGMTQILISRYHHNHFIFYKLIVASNKKMSEDEEASNIIDFEVPKTQNLITPFLTV